MNGEPRRFSDEELFDMRERLGAHIEDFERCKQSFDEHTAEEMEHHERQQQQIDQLVETVKRIDDNTSAFVQVWQDAAGTGRTFAAIGRGVKWAAIVGGSFAILWNWGIHLWEFLLHGPNPPQ